MPMHAKIETKTETMQSLGYLSRYAHRAFVKALARELEPHGILTSQWAVLRILWGSSGLTQVELAELMRVEKASLFIEVHTSPDYDLNPTDAGPRRK